MPSLPRTKADSLKGTCRHPPIPTSPGENWIDRLHLHMPPEITCVARALYWGPTAHGDKQKAWHMAVGIAENWASGKGNVTAATRARASAAVAVWESMRAAAHGKSAAKKAVA